MNESSLTLCSQAPPSAKSGLSGCGNAPGGTFREFVFWGADFFFYERGLLVECMIQAIEQMLGEHFCFFSESHSRLGGRLGVFIKFDPRPDIHLAF